MNLVVTNMKFFVVISFVAAFTHWSSFMWHVTFRMLAFLRSVADTDCWLLLLADCLPKKSFIIAIWHLNCTLIACTDTSLLIVASITCCCLGILLWVLVGGRSLTLRCSRSKQCWVYMHLMFKKAGVSRCNSNRQMSPVSVLWHSSHDLHSTGGLIQLAVSRDKTGQFVNLQLTNEERRHLWVSVTSVYLLGYLVCFLPYLSSILPPPCGCVCGNWI